MEKIFVGAVSVDITPKLPVSLVGQYYRRCANRVFTPLRAQVLTVQSGEELVTFVACDLLGIPEAFAQQVRQEVRKLKPDYPVESIIMTAIHTHSAPRLAQDHGSTTWGKDFDWTPGHPDEQRPEEYARDIAWNIARGIIEAWNSRRPAKYSTGMDHISISYNRRTVYADGSAQMYGNTNRPDFVRMEGSGDDSIHFMAFEDEESGKLLAALIEVACPAQILEHHDFVASDYWEEARDLVAQRWGAQAVLLGICGAAGDLSPRDLISMAMPEPDMHATAMYQIEGAKRIAKRIMTAFDSFMENRTYEENPVLTHRSRVINLPLWQVTEAERDAARIDYNKWRGLHKDMNDFTESEAYNMSISAGILVRWELQQKIKEHPVEIHAIRLGSAWMATNPFELFVEYSDRIRSRFGGGNGFICQLSGGYQGYLPSAPAIAHKGYSALVCNGLYGAEGGDILVEQTLSLLQSCTAD